METMWYIDAIGNGEFMNLQEIFELLTYPQTEEFYKDVSDIWVKGFLKETLYGVLYTMVIYLGCYLLGA